MVEKKEEEFKKDLASFSDKLWSNKPVDRKIVHQLYALNHGLLATSESGAGIGFYPSNNGIVFDFLKRGKGDTFKIVESRRLITDNWAVIHLEKAIEMSKELGEEIDPDTDYIKRVISSSFPLI
ncbi:unnamed protein product [marine sediment metagenome]|uniref:Uncharacterized protein n=1 Tax=marine sediment metagenome TaxID=412755 RepID=X1D0D6_9ZZZZ